MRTYRQAQRRSGAARAIVTTVAAAGLFYSATLLTVIADSAQAQGASISIGDATAGPGENADVAVSFTSEEMAASVQIDVLYNEDEALIDDPVSACVLAERLTQQSLSATFPSTQPDPPMRRLRLGVFPPLVNPNPTFASGEVVTCSFAVGAEVAAGTEIALAADRTQVARDEVVICGQGGDLPCEEDDGVISVGDGTTETPTATPTESGTEGPTVEPTEVPTGGVATPTPTGTVDTCMTDEDCPDGMQCQLPGGTLSGEGPTGVCVPDDCTEDTDCDLNETCEDGVCRDIPCSGPDDCPLGTQCDAESDTCVQIPCTGNEQCPTNTTCEDGVCTPECRVDGDCTEGVCVDNSCVECRDDEDCESTEFCGDDNTCQPLTGDSLEVTGGSGLPGGTASLSVALVGDGASEVANTLTISGDGLAIAACTANAEIPAAFELSGAAVAAELGGEGVIPAGALYACDVSIAEGTAGGSRQVTCSAATADGANIPCNDVEIVVEMPTPTNTPTATPTETRTPTHTFTPTDTPTSTSGSGGSGEDDGCAVVPPAQSGMGVSLLLLLAPALLLWSRRREW